MENLELIKKAEADRLNMIIAALENEILMGEYMDFLPAGYYRKLDKLDALRAQRKQMGAN